jgi:hypothetical protein
MTDYTTISVSRSTKRAVDKCAMKLHGLEADQLAYDVVLASMANEINEGDN